jgi:hypothetical protein
MNRSHRILPWLISHGHRRVRKSGLDTCTTQIRAGDLCLDAVKGVDVLEEEDSFAEAACLVQIGPGLLQQQRVPAARTHHVCHS